MGPIPSRVHTGGNQSLFLELSLSQISKNVSSGEDVKKEYHSSVWLRKTEILIDFSIKNVFSPVISQLSVKAGFCSSEIKATGGPGGKKPHGLAEPVLFPGFRAVRAGYLLRSYTRRYAEPLR